MAELDAELQKVAYYAKYATYNCHHLVPQSNLNGCLRTYYPNTNQLLTFDESKVILADRDTAEMYIDTWLIDCSPLSMDLK